MAVTIYSIILSLIFLIFFIFSNYIFIMGIKSAFIYLKLSLGGIKTEAIVVSIDNDRIRENVDEYGLKTTTYMGNYFEVVSYKVGKNEYQNRLYAKSGRDKLYSIGDKIEIYYNTNNPNEIADANSKGQLIKGILSSLFGIIFSYISFILLKKYLFTFFKG